MPLFLVFLTNGTWLTIQAHNKKDVFNRVRKTRVVSIEPLPHHVNF